MRSARSQSPATAYLQIFSMKSSPSKCSRNRADRLLRGLKSRCSRSAAGCCCCSSRSRAGCVAIHLHWAFRLQLLGGGFAGDGREALKKLGLGRPEWLPADVYAKLIFGSAGNGEAERAEAEERRLGKGARRIS